jgi:hypothetical protein
MMLVIACHQERGLHELLDDTSQLIELSIEGGQVRLGSPSRLLGLSPLGICLCSGDSDLPASE